MSRTRVHELAKELGVDARELIAKLDNIGIHGKRSQSSLTDDEVERVRAALTIEDWLATRRRSSQPFDAVVDERALQGVETRTVVERRVRTNVIRRRTSRPEPLPDLKMSVPITTEPITTEPFETFAEPEPIVPPELPPVGAGQEPWGLPPTAGAPNEPGGIVRGAGSLAVGSQVSLTALPSKVSEDVTRCLRAEADGLAQAAAGDLPEADTIEPTIALALQGAGLGREPAQACARLLAEAILPPVGPLDEVWHGLRNAASAGKQELGSGDMGYFTTRVAKLTDLPRDTARRAVYILALAAGLRIRESAAISTRQRALQEEALRALQRESSLAAFPLRRQDLADATQVSGNSIASTSGTEPASAPSSVPATKANAGEKLRQALKAAPLGTEVRVSAGEFQGPFEIPSDVKVVGQGDASTLWCRGGPVVVVKGDGVVLRNLLIEAVGANGVALRNEASQPPDIRNVTIRGQTEGLSSKPAPGGQWDLPTAVDFGVVASRGVVERLVDIETPGPTDVFTQVAGVSVDPRSLPGGRCQLRITLDAGQLVAGGILMGDIEISAGGQQRMIPISAASQAAVPVLGSAPAAARSSAPSIGAPPGTAPSAGSPDSCAACGGTHAGGGPNTTACSFAVGTSSRTRAAPLGARSTKPAQAPPPKVAARASASAGTPATATSPPKRSRALEFAGLVGTILFVIGVISIVRRNPETGRSQGFASPRAAAPAATAPALARQQPDAALAGNVERARSQSQSAKTAVNEGNHAAQGVVIDFETPLLVSKGSPHMCVRMSGGNRRVAGLQMDFHWDEGCAKPTVPTGETPKCFVNIATPKRIITTARENTSFRALLVSTESTEPIPDGWLFCCPFILENPSVAATCQISVENLIASTPDGRRLSDISARPGTLYVSVPRGGAPAAKRQMAAARPAGRVAGELTPGSERCNADPFAPGCSASAPQVERSMRKIE